MDLTRRALLANKVYEKVDYLEGLTTGGVDPPWIYVSTEEKRNEEKGVSKFTIRYWYPDYSHPCSDVTYHCTNLDQPYECIVYLEDDGWFYEKGMLDLYEDDFAGSRAEVERFCEENQIRIRTQKIDAYDDSNFSNINTRMMYIPSEKVAEHINDIFDGALIRELHEADAWREEICPRCNGTGIVKSEHIYLGDDRTQWTPFPYIRQAFVRCPDCVDGIVKVCRHCGKIIYRDMMKCTCAAQQKKDEEEKAKREREWQENARILEPWEVERMEMFYSEDYPENNGRFSDWDRFFDAWEENHKTDDPRPEFVWATERFTMPIDAEIIVEDACSRMEEEGEEIYDRVRDKVPALQEFLDEWINANGAESYLRSTKEKVRIPWERRRKTV